MRRENYEYAMSKEQLSTAVEHLESFSKMLETAANAMRVFAQTGRESMKVRDAVSRAKLPLDFADFLAEVRKVSPKAADALQKAEVIRFELGRLKLRFESGMDKIQLDWHKHTLETISQKLYKLPLKISSAAIYPNG